MNSGLPFNWLRNMSTGTPDVVVSGVPSPTLIIRDGTHRLLSSSAGPLQPFSATGSGYDPAPSPMAGATFLLTDSADPSQSIGSLSKIDE